MWLAIQWIVQMENKERCYKLTVPLQNAMHCYINIPNGARRTLLIADGATLWTYFVMLWFIRPGDKGSFVMLSAQPNVIASSKTWSEIIIECEINAIYKRCKPKRNIIKMQATNLKCGLNDYFGNIRYRLKPFSTIIHTSFTNLNHEHAFVLETKRPNQNVQKSL